MYKLRIINILIIFIFFAYTKISYSDTNQLYTEVFSNKNRSIVYNFANGHMWNTLGYQSKRLYLIGLKDGISLLTIKMVDSKRSREQSGVDTVVESHFLRLFQNDYKSSISKIDHVYNNILNRKIPIIDIYTLIIAKNEMADDMLLKLRNKYLND